MTVSMYDYELSVESLDGLAFYRREFGTGFIELTNYKNNIDNKTIVVEFPWMLFDQDLINVNNNELCLNFRSIPNLTDFTEFFYNQKGGDTATKHILEKGLNRIYLFFTDIFERSNFNDLKLNSILNEVFPSYIILYKSDVKYINCNLILNNNKEKEKITKVVSLPNLEITLEKRNGESRFYDDI